MTFSLDGWSIGHTNQAEWVPWGTGDKARAKVLANGDGYNLVLVEAEPGYRGDPHEHGHTEFLYVLSGTLQSQGCALTAGSAYVAAARSTHDEFTTADGASYVSIFKL